MNGRRPCSGLPSARLADMIEPAGDQEAREAAIEAACRRRRSASCSAGLRNPLAPCQATGVPRSQSGPMSKERSVSDPEVQPAAGREARAPARRAPARRRARCGGRSRAGADRRPGRRIASSTRRSEPPSAGYGTTSSSSRLNASGGASLAAISRASAGHRASVRGSDSERASWPGSRREIVEPRLVSRGARRGRSCCTSASARSPAPSAACAPLVKGTAPARLAPASSSGVNGVEDVRRHQRVLVESPARAGRAG